jgi:hypothetical protein
MPEFIEFARQDARGRQEALLFTWQARGLLSINLAAFRALGEPEAVTLLYDPKEGIVGLRTARPQNENAYPVRKQKKAQSWVVGAQGFASYHGIKTVQARRFVGHDYGGGIWGFALREGVPVTNRRGAGERSPALTTLWRQTTDGFEAAALMRVGDVAISHPGASRPPHDRPPSLRLGSLIACEAVGPELATSNVRRAFIEFLSDDPVMSLLRQVTSEPSSADWVPWGGHGLANHEAILTTGNVRDDVPPLASALLLLPDPSTSAFGRDSRFAELVVDIDLIHPNGEPAAPMSVNEWHSRFVHAFEVPESFSAFLTEELGLATTADPPAQFGIWLKSRQALTEMVDPGELALLPGSFVPNWFVTYAVADPSGQPPRGAAAKMIRQMLDFTLHVTDYEKTLTLLNADG